MKLSYLFECHFKDGTMIQQTEQDVSTIDPARSAFYDVMQRLDDVVVFGVYNEQSTYAVDLRDGHFEINGFSFNVNKEELPEDAKRELVYFRRHVHVTVVGQEAPPEDVSHSVEYFLGWRAMVDGKEIQQTISVT
jgi:hypothetical protein